MLQKDISKTSLLDNWKAMTICCIIAMAPFQYGIDFGMIGGLQGNFDSVLLLTDSNAWISTSLRLRRPSITHRIQHFANRTATHLVVDDPWSCCWLSFVRTSRCRSQSSPRPLARHNYMLHR